MSALFDNLRGIRSWLMLYVLFIMLAVMMFMAGPGMSQTYPVSNPTYIPSAVLSPVTLTTTGDILFQAVNTNTISVRVTGTFSVLAGNIQGSNDNTNWTNLQMLPVGGGSVVTSFSAAGFWTVNAAGMRQVRAHVTSLTGTNVIVGMVGSLAPNATVTLNVQPTDLGAVITNAAQVPATVTSSDQINNGYRAVTCVFNQSAHASSPSTTFTIQGKDSASASYYTLITSSAIVADATPTAVSAGAGMATTANVSTGIMLPAIWRISETVGGTGSTTGTVGCNVN